MTDIAIRVSNLSKCYQIYDNPRDRLKQFVVPKLYRAMPGLRKLPLTHHSRLYTPQSDPVFYKEFWALKDVTFEIKKGETVGIIGRNGSGKSTLLQLICGTLNQTSGQVESNGRIAALLELGSGFNPEFTGRENVYMNAAVLGVKKETIQSRFDEIAEFADIGDFIERPVKTYSSGMVVRLAFAVSICVDPDILVIDEALAVGDIAFQRKCFSHIEQFRKRGGTILFCSHSAQDIIQLCDQAVLIDQGEMLIKGLPKPTTSLYIKLSNSSPSTLKIIRESVLRGTHETSFDSVNQGNSVKSSLSEIQNELDSSFETKSPYFFESLGGFIRDFRICHPHGEDAKNLHSGHSFRLGYSVDFDLQVEQLGFEFIIKTVNGIVVGGSDTSRAMSHLVNFAEAGSTASVHFEFDCNLVPGVYFASASVRGMVNGNFVLLHKIQEGIMFTVSGEEYLAQFGIANLKIIPDIKIEPPNKGGR